MPNRLKYKKKENSILVKPIFDKHESYYMTLDEFENEFIKPFGFIYKIINLENDKIYIGQTVRDILIRWREHIYDGYNKKKCFPISKAIQKYGENSFEIEVLQKCKNKKELEYYEKYYIKKYKSNNKIFGYNLTSGGRCLSGKQNPNYGNHILRGRKRPEHSKCMSGKYNPMYGKSVYDIWLEKYGKEEADDKLKSMKQKHMGVR